ncbi:MULTISPECIES: HAD family phosphatase [unclassified Microbacterium]|uniref:HAD family hydrolase n=1 Tax=unclassified Microbacterium TaxID=2609290 RepID=UPI000C2C353F|nr:MULTISPECIES: HAD-IA family hydrolase [unclassified Microbacterium]
MTHFDAVVFDCDGVLVDSEVLSARVSQRILSDLGWNAALEELMELFTGCSQEFFVAEIERRIGRRLEPGWDDPYAGWLMEAFRCELTAVPGIESALEQIALPVAVASNSGRERIRSSLDLVGLLPRFAGKIASAEDVVAGKPEPDVYLRAAEILGVAPERCIAIDDSAFGVEAARRAGMYVLAYGPGAATRAGDGVPSISDLRLLPAVVDRLVSLGSTASGRR